MQAIPKLLWDLGSAKPAVTHTALALLHTALRLAPVGSALSSALDSMQPQLCPFYCSLLAPKGSKGAAQAGKNGVRALKIVVPGPLAQLPTDAQVGVPRFSDWVVISASGQSTLDMSCSNGACALTQRILLQGLGLTPHPTSLQWCICSLPNLARHSGSASCCFVSCVPSACRRLSLNVAIGSQYTRTKLVPDAYFACRFDRSILHLVSAT